MNNRANLIRAIASAHKLNEQGNERLVRQFLQLQPILGILIRRLSLYKHSLVGTIHSGLRSRLFGIAIPVQSTERSAVSQIGLVEECTVSYCRLTAEVVLFSSTLEKPRESRPPPTSPSASRRTHSEPQNICGPVPGVVVHNRADNHLYTPPTDHRPVIQSSGVWLCSYALWDIRRKIAGTLFNFFKIWTIPIFRDKSLRPAVTLSNRVAFSKMVLASTGEGYSLNNAQIRNP